MVYEYQARLIRVVDGDTVRLDVDLGFDIHHVNLDFRLYGINAPEHGTPEGDAATSHLVGLIPQTVPFTIQTQKDKQDKYGRYLVTIIVNGNNINDQMVKDGQAKPYFGFGPKP